LGPLFIYSILFIFTLFIFILIIIIIIIIIIFIYVYLVIICLFFYYFILLLLKNKKKIWKGDSSCCAPPLCSGIACTQPCCVKNGKRSLSKFSMSKNFAKNIRKSSSQHVQWVQKCHKESLNWEQKKSEQEV